MPQHLTVLLCQLALLPALSVANGVQHTKLAPGKGKVVRILALGDSLTEGVSDYADKKRYPVSIHRDSLCRQRLSYSLLQSEPARVLFPN